MRENLDPEGLYQDDTLWEVLERCYLKDPVQELGGLGHMLQREEDIFLLGRDNLFVLLEPYLQKQR